MQQRSSWDCFLRQCCALYWLTDTEHKHAACLYSHFQPTRVVFGNKTFGKVTWCRGRPAVPFCCVKVVTVFPPLLLKFLKPVCHILTSCSLQHKEPEHWWDHCISLVYEHSNSKYNKNPQHRSWADHQRVINQTQYDLKEIHSNVVSANLTSLAGMPNPFAI